MMQKNFFIVFMIQQFLILKQKEAVLKAKKRITAGKAVSIDFQITVS